MKTGARAGIKSLSHDGNGIHKNKSVTFYLFATDCREIYSL